MGRTKLGVCMEDEEYRKRFVKCVMTHYRESYEIHVIEKDDDAGDETMDIILVDQSKAKEGVGVQVLILSEQGATETEVPAMNGHYTEKYQEVYKIIEKVELLSSKEGYPLGKIMGQAKPHIIGVFSLSREALQIPFTILLAEIIGERDRVLVVDLQPYSGFGTEMEIEESCLGMEDVMAIATTEVYTTGRIAASIGSEQKWDFIYPPKNMLCLMEGDKNLYLRMLEILQKERGYEQFIVNFGGLFSGIMEAMELCDQFYFLVEKKEELGWREKSFIEELKRRGKEVFLEKIYWVDIPSSFVRERSWKELTKGWLWSEFGDQFREIYWMEKKHG